jgi:hypothetical protein
MRIVDGDEVLADSQGGFLSACTAFEACVSARIKSGL